MKNITQHLENAPLHRFADWPIREIPRVTAGIYAIFDKSDKFLYVGMAGAGLNSSTIERKRSEGKQSGLFDRLASHASGYRSGDRFNVYIGDLFVLSLLSSDQIAAIANRKLSFDSLIKQYIRENLSFRYIELPNSEVRAAERYIQKHGLHGTRPTINPLD